MADFEHTRVIDADPRAVFDIASAESSLDSWTPEGIEVESEGGGVLHTWVSSGSEVRDETGYVEADREQLRLRWGGTETGYEGWLQLEPRAEGQPGHTLATLHVTCTGAAPETLGGEYSADVETWIEQALDRLAALVHDSTETTR
ncbi:SRPBCC family protein [Saccharomonospora xinjiangensis]|uniref:Polyketide cyclase / dehydrase and lipid transport n=1 Tax=Saccharomonospora xinjiangensis XJ-54 TaxID=882086 RepID=I0UYX0_9PSEU|nr:SRPBCC family protein [Saccharomonospora xinjiangensis]EID53073.1 Polyketide cyclase / dehydrase and lipid transport [Saccharomonospora xinjiangensis XJ-54]QBQ59625.1 Polyketide cyclase / dehydrase and lipid transport [Saccharomonospora xinjiangensis]